MRRWIFIIFGVALLIVVSVPTAVIYYLAYTEPGLQWIVAHIPNRIGRTEMEFVGATGTLAKGFTLERFELEHERVHLRFEGCVGHVTLLPLMWQTIHAEDVTMRSAYVEVRRWKNPPPRSSPRFLPRGLIIEAEKVHVNDGTFIAQNGRRFDLTNVNTSGVARYRTIRLFDASFTQDAIQVSGKATLRAEEPMGLDADARMLIRMENQPLWLMTATGTGNLDHLPITGSVQSPFQATVTGSADDLTTAWNWSGDAKVTHLDIRAWGGGGALGRIHGELRVKGDASGFEGRGPMISDGLRAGAFDTVFVGNYADRTIQVAHVEATHQASKAHVEGEGAIRIVPGGPDLNLHGTYRDFRWPLTGETAAVKSAGGEFSIRGVRPFDVRMAGPIEAGGLAPMQVEMEGKLAADRLSVTTADVEAFDGQAVVSGEAVWSPKERWAVAGRASDINPAHIRPDLPGSLSFQFAAEGLGFGTRGDLSVDVRGLTGRLRGSPASGRGALPARARRGSWTTSVLRSVAPGFRPMARSMRRWTCVSPSKQKT